MSQAQHHGAGSAGFPDEADQLYGLPLEQFVKEREELARRLRQEGRRGDAAGVAKLRKPSLPAWAANQVLRSQPRGARELRAAGRALADTQSAALGGRATPSELRDAIDRHRAALAEMMGAAGGLLDNRGHSLSPPTLERVRNTLAAASLDPDLAREAEHGRLVREHLYTGLDQVAPPRAAGPAKAQSSRPVREQRRSRAPADASRERRQREAARRRRAAKLTAARSRLAEAKKAAAAAAKARDATARAARTATVAHERAEQRLSKALEAQALGQVDLDALAASDRAT